MLYSDSASCFLIGCLCNNPSVLRSGKYPLQLKDFEPNILHKFLFGVINNLAYQGVEEITEIEIDQYATPYPKIQQVFEAEDALNFIRIVKQQSNAKTINFYYETVKKFSLLREAKNQGYDISSIFDEEQSYETQIVRLNEVTILQLLNRFEQQIIQLKKDFLPYNVQHSMWAGDNFQEVLELFEQEPVMGAGLNSEYENSIWRGWQKGHLLMRSGGSGVGKTTRLIGDICHVGCKYLWHEQQQEFIANPFYQGPGFIIHTEMDQKYELQPKLLAYITNLPLHYILDGNYTVEHKKRLLNAADILLDSKIKLIDLPNFTIPLLNNTIKECAITDGCEYGVFDYVEDNGTVGKIYKEEVGTALRSDMVLLAIVSNLKTIAEDCKIGLLTGSQLNGLEKSASIIDERCLAGSKAMKNKLDGGSILMHPTKAELEQTSGLNKKRGFGPNECNLVSHVYKGRFSQYGQNLKIFHSFDYGTGRIEDLYVTNVNNEPIHVDRVQIVNQ